MNRTIIIVSVIVGVIVIIALVLGLTLGLKQRSKPSFKSVFFDRCEAFDGGHNCEQIWNAFEQAYVNRDPCNVSVEAYDSLIASAPFKAECDKMIFWSKTKDVAHDFTDKKKCFITLEDTLLGSVLDGLNWCGKEGSHETFTEGCPEWEGCEHSPIRSFWKRASAAFAEAACGNVTAMLNGSITTPYDPKSIFASVEVKNFNSTRVTNLIVVLVTQEHIVANCSNPSLEDLRKDLDGGIQFDCKEVPQAQLEECASNSAASCEPCW